MYPEIILRYLHFISVFTLVSTVVAEHLLVKPEMSRAEIKKLSRVDAVYGVSAMVLLVVGITLWLSDIGKPAEFYSKNWIFHTKVTCFVLIGLFSIYPTVYFIKQAKGNQEEVVPTPKNGKNDAQVGTIVDFHYPHIGRDDGQRDRV